MVCCCLKCPRFFITLQMFNNALMIKGVLQLFCIWCSKYDILLLVPSPNTWPCYPKASHWTTIPFAIDEPLYPNVFIWTTSKVCKTWELYETKWFLILQPILSPEKARWGVFSILQPLELHELMTLFLKRMPFPAECPSPPPSRPNAWKCHPCHSVTMRTIWGPVGRKANNKNNIERP